ncbi:hypothetical protein [Brachybacterium sp. GPGPB12]|uniref:hypothetical protein n=1 Tax=Brachybacterium sp. GPGPB12 TaxID=3023517 RepID=UPI00313464EF
MYTMTLAGLTIAPAYDVALTCRSRTGGVAPGPLPHAHGEDGLRAGAGGAEHGAVRAAGADPARGAPTGYDGVGRHRHLRSRR